MRRLLPGSLLLLSLPFASCSLPAQTKPKPDPLTEAVRKYEKRLLELEAAMRRSGGTAPKTVPAASKPAGGKPAEKPPVSKPTGRPQGRGSDKPTTEDSATAARRALARLNEDLEKSRQAKAKLEKELATAKTDLSASRERERIALQSRDTFAARANRLEVTLIQRRRENATLEKARAAIATEREALVNRLRETAESKADVQTLLVGARAKVRSLEEHAEKQTAEVESLRKERAALQRQSTDLRSLGQGSAKALEAAREQLVTARKQLADYSTKTSALESALAKARESLTSAAADHDRLKQMATQVEQRASKLLSETRRLQNANAKLTAASARSQATAADARERIQDLVAQNRTLATRERESHTSGAGKDEEIQRLSEQLARMQEECAALTKQNQTLRQAVLTPPPAPAGDDGIHIYNQGGTVIIHRGARSPRPAAQILRLPPASSPTSPAKGALPPGKPSPEKARPDRRINF